MDSGGGANPVSCKWVKQQGPAKGFDFDESKVEQIFDLLLREKQLKLPEGHKFPIAKELQGRSYCKWHHLFTHTTNDCKELRCHTPFRDRGNEASKRVPRMFHSHV
jgi:hypothetical protein